MNIIRGINFSVRDENLHSVAGAYCFRLKLKESNLNEDEKQLLTDKILSSASILCEHEFRIIDMIFEKGKIDGVSEKQMKNFVESRINLCLKELGLPKLYEISYDPISEWFYDGINGLQFNDFFTGLGNSYNRNWSESEFTW